MTTGIWVLPDPQAAVRAVLRAPTTATAGLTDYGPTVVKPNGDPRGPLVYYPRIPGGVPMPRKAVAFRFDGGNARRGVRITRARVEFRCFGEDDDEAAKVERALYADLHGLTNRLAATPGGLAGLLGFYQDVAARPGLSDPETGWPFVLTIYGVTFANDALFG